MIFFLQKQTHKLSSSAEGPGERRRSDLSGGEKPTSPLVPQDRGGEGAGREAPRS